MPSDRAWTIKGVSDRSRAAGARPPIKRADVGPARAGVRGEAARGQAPGRPRRGLSEEVTARITELLHRAGRSASAISQELGVSYPTVRARVKALEAG